ncbi:MAG: permease, partial [Gammaproteobacteria bacterium]
AVGALTWLALVHAPEAPIADFFTRLLRLSLDAAPALLLAYLVGGLVGSELPDRWLRWIGRGGAASQALRGMAVGLPLPVCSCGVLPLYQSLIRRGLPVAAALAFLIATPEIGLTALFVSLPLLGVELTLLRVAAAGALAFAVAFTIARFVPVTAAGAAGANGCCGGRPPTRADGRLQRALRTGLVDLVDDSFAWILIGLALAAALMPYIQPLFWAALPDAAEVVLFALLGMPIYVCAAGATPLVAVLIAGGVSPGAAIAFLLTGPATNISTFGILRALHGTSTALRFAAATAVGAVLLGLLVDALLPAGFGARVPAAHAHAPAAYEWLSLLLLGALYAAALLRKGLRALFSDLIETPRALAG